MSRWLCPPDTRPVPLSSLTGPNHPRFRTPFGLPISHHPQIPSSALRYDRHPRGSRSRPSSPFSRLTPLRYRHSLVHSSSVFTPAAPAARNGRGLTHRARRAPIILPDSVSRLPCPPVLVPHRSSPPGILQSLPPIPRRHSALVLLFLASLHTSHLHSPHPHTVPPLSFSTQICKRVSSPRSIPRSPSCFSVCTVPAILAAHILPRTIPAPASCQAVFMQPAPALPLPEPLQLPTSYASPSLSASGHRSREIDLAAAPPYICTFALSFHITPASGPPQDPPALL